MLDCIKTACVVFLEEYEMYIYGDAYEGDNFYIFRTVGQATSNREEYPVKHFDVKRITHWFDEQHISRYGTLFVYMQDATNYGYEGVPL